MSAALALCLGATVQAACLSPQQQLPAATISAFTSNPAQLLAQNPNGGPNLVAQIRDLAASDPATLPLIAQLVANANPAQKSAIGSGLGQAASICGGQDQAHANLIQQAVVQARDPAVTTAYAAVTGQQPLGGIGAALGGLGGSLGGQTTPLGQGPTSTGGPQPIGGPGVPTQPFTFTSSVAGTGISTTTETNGVSP